MRAIRYHRYGDSDVLQYEEAERPVPGRGQALVQVAGTTFNPVESGIRAGALKDVFPVEFPHVPGIDVSGTIAELGPEVEGFRLGEAVIGFLPMSLDGAAAEYALVPAEVLVAAPATVPLADAAALPVGALTAYQALFDDAELKEGQKVLVNGASGAVGGYAVQLAHNAGAIVAGTAGARHTDRLRGYGADSVGGPLNFADQPVVVAGGPFDVVVNLVATSPEETASLVDLVADGGVLVSTTTPPPQNPERGIRTARVFVVSKADQLARLVADVDAGRLQVYVADHRPLAELPAVHDAAASGGLVGKTVLTP